MSSATLPLRLLPQYASSHSHPQLVHGAVSDARSLKQLRAALQSSGVAAEAVRADQVDVERIEANYGAGDVVLALGMPVNAALMHLIGAAKRQGALTMLFGSARYCGGADVAYRLPNRDSPCRLALAVGGMAALLQLPTGNNGDVVPVLRDSGPGAVAVGAAEGPLRADRALAAAFADGVAQGVDLRRAHRVVALISSRPFRNAREHRLIESRIRAVLPAGADCVCRTLPGVAETASLSVTLLLSGFARSGPIRR